MYLSTVFYRKKDLYTISDIEIFIFYLNLMTLPVKAAFFSHSDLDRIFLHVYDCRAAGCLKGDAVR